MKFLVDANLSPVVATALTEAGYESSHVRELGLVTASDSEITASAVKANAVVISADSDFATLLALSGEVAPSLVLLRSADHLPPLSQAAILIANLPSVLTELTDGAVVSIVHGHVRVRRLPLK
ncbi:DUF5615 family PIN-like protein [Humibacter ginsengisoli]